MENATRRAQTRRSAAPAPPVAVPEAAVPEIVPETDPAVEARDAQAGPATTEIMRVGFAPIVRVDAERHEIELCATSEALDSYGTVFDYEASKAAFTRWIGNVREMHDYKAVGRRVEVRCDDMGRRVYVRVRISRGAHDTWEKIVDGTLRGASIGANHVIWSLESRRVRGHHQVVQVATAYELVELSLVDSPSNPDALGITIVRAAEPLPEMLADLEDETPRPLWPLRPEHAESGSLTTAAAPAGTGVPLPPGAAAPEHATQRDEAAPGSALAGVAARALGPFSTNAAGVPDMGVPERANEPPATEAQTPAAGNARERFHAAARGILLGCGCALCEAALAAISATDAPEGEATRGGALVAPSHEAALARALAAG
ncbi:MAG: HK97 family phage prohead protease, partial [Ktedonobacterales bacterium]